MTDTSANGHRNATLRVGDSARDWAVWRVWAADVRDDQGVSQEVSEAAGLLASLLDNWEVWRRRADREGSATNLVDPLEQTAEALVGRLLAAGVRGPAQVRG